VQWALVVLLVCRTRTLFYACRASRARARTHPLKTLVFALHLMSGICVWVRAHAPFVVVVVVIVAIVVVIVAVAAAAVVPIRLLSAWRL
jgi:hypothetical protein